MKKENATDEQSHTIKAYGWGFWLWLFSVALFVLFVAFFAGAWAVRHITSSDHHPRFSDRQAELVLFVADFPTLMKTTFQELWAQRKEDVVPQLLSRKATEQPGWVRHFPEPEDSGYLLFSGIDSSFQKTVIKLIRISDGVTVASWLPDGSGINEMISGKNAPKGNWRHLRAMHPALLPDGDVIFNTGSLLVRQSPCSVKPVWVLDEIMHHSIELDESGDALWVGAVAHDGFPDNAWLRDKIVDDALAYVSTDGRLLKKLSIVRIMRDNGLEALALATSGLKIPNDPIHLNQIKVARQDTRYWQRGDLLISARNISALFLYRPSTNTIIWHQVGPWMNQHSADFVGDHRISVFNNNVVSGPEEEGKKLFLQPSDTNQVMVYDFDTKEVTQPFSALLAEARPRTFSEGRARLLPDGGLYLEETNYGRQLRFTKDRLLWSRVNDYDDKRIGLVSWSRYLTAEEARVPLQALAKRKCAT